MNVQKYLIVFLLIGSAYSAAIAADAVATKVESKTDLGYLLPDSMGSPLELPLDQLNTQNQLLGFRIDQAISELSKVQTDLVNTKQFLDQHGYNATKYMETFVDRFDALPDYIKDILRGNEEFSKEDLKIKSVEFRNLINLIDVGENLGGELVEKYKKFSQRYSDISAAISFYFLNLELESARQKQGADGRLAIYKDRYDKIIEAKNLFVANRSQYGKAKGELRASPFNRMIAMSRSLIFKIQKDENLGDTPKRNVLAKMVNETMKALSNGVKIAMEPLVPRIKKVALRQGKKWILERAPTPENAPLAYVVNNTVKLIGRLKGEKAQIVGAENYIRTKEKKVINILMPSHSDGFKDALGVAQLNENGIAFFAAPGNFLPPDIAAEMMPAFNKSMSIIVVGKKHNPNPVPTVQKMIQIVEAGVTTFLLYPQGMLPTADNMISTVREGAFDIDGPIRELERLGYKVNIIPASMRLNSTPFGVNLKDEMAEEEKTDATVEIKIHKPILDEVRHVFMRLTTAQAFPTLFHYGLMDELISSKLPNGELDPNGKLLWGQVRIEKLQQVLGLYLKAKTGTSDRTQCLRYYSL